MITNPVTKILGADATGFPAIKYNEQKVAEREAYRAALYNFGKIQEHDIHSPRVMINYLQRIAKKNDRVTMPQKHVLLSLGKDATQEEIDDAVKKMHEALNQMGYNGQPQAIYVHHDTANVHIHTVTVTVSRENGEVINQWKDGIRMHNIINDLYGIKHQENLEKLCDYAFESRQQFMNLLLNNGYKTATIDEAGGQIIVPPMAHAEADEAFTIPLEEIDARAAANGKNKDKYEARRKQIFSLIMKYRRESMNYVVDTPPERKRREDGSVKHTRTQQLNQVLYGKFKGSKYLEMEEIRKQQMKLFLQKMKQLGIQIVFNEWQDKQVKGFTVIDHTGGEKGEYRHGIVFKGSDIMNLQQLLNPEWKRGKEADAVISARDAAEASKELNITPGENAKGIVALLNVYDVAHDIKDIPEKYFKLTKKENIEKAREYAARIPELQKMDQETAENYARLAYVHACAADIQEAEERVDGGQRKPDAPIQKPDTQQVIVNADTPAQDGHSLDDTQGESKPESRTEEKEADVQPLPFVDIHAEVKDGKIVVAIDNTEHTADLMPIHRSWYDSQPDKRRAANVLAMHYFPQEIYERQLSNYRTFFLNRDEMPQGIEIENPHVNFDPNNRKYELHSRFLFNKRSQKIYEKMKLTPEQVAGLKHSRYTERQLAVRHLGPKILREQPEARPKNFTEAKDMILGGENASFGTTEAIGETMKVFDGIAESLAGAVHAALGLIVGAGAHPSVCSGGGGGSKGGWRDKKPEDWRQYDLFIPSKKSKGLKR